MAATVESLNTIARFIGGKQKPATGGRKQDVYSPATGEVMGLLQLAGQADIDDVVVARKAAESWSQSWL